MTLALWMLLGFAGWTLMILVAGVGISRWLLIFQGAAELTSFPGDTPHGSPAYRRATRAHANCVETLPVFAAIVLTAATAHLSPAHFDTLAVVTLTARIPQTLVHTFLPLTNTSIGVRFAFFMVQAVAMTAMAVLLGMAAAG